jgi:hypothetical protein
MEAQRTSTISNFCSKIVVGQVCILYVVTRIHGFGCLISILTIFFNFISSIIELCATAAKIGSTSDTPVREYAVVWSKGREPDAYYG